MYSSSRIAEKSKTNNFIKVVFILNTRTFSRYVRNIRNYAIKKKLLPAVQLSNTLLVDTFEMNITPDKKPVGDSMIYSTKQGILSDLL